VCERAYNHKCASAQEPKQNWGPIQQNILHAFGINFICMTD